MGTRLLRKLAPLGILCAVIYPAAAQSEKIFHVDLAYGSPGHGPATNFTPYGTQVKLFDLPAETQLPEGAIRPAKAGTIPIGPDQRSWIKILVTADAAHPQDLDRLYIDTNRNGLFDDGPPIAANLTQNPKTKAWSSNFNRAEFSIFYPDGISEPYMVTLWAVRDSDETPSVIRYTVISW
ncbi:MAG TPA: hypothetical protein VKS01_00415, partial [Bryobacteraceae bacterium]|nr:hypothetical protein [Bryobacteraceae bacterium]